MSTLKKLKKVIFKTKVVPPLFDLETFCKKATRQKFEILKTILFHEI